VNDQSGRRVRLGRRSRHRRRRALRRLAIFVVSIGFLSLVIWRYLPTHLYFRSHQAQSAVSSWEKQNPHDNLALLAGQPRHKNHWVPRSRLFYPYSVIPGGVKDPDELRVAMADRAVARHFSGFNWERARLITLNQPRMLYLSYRLGDRIFWTKKRVSLGRGERLITDGKISARTRCGNRVEAAAQPDVSDEEPSEAELEDPFVADGSAIHMPVPANFESALRAPEGPALIAQGPPPLSPLPGGILFPIGPPVDVCGLKDKENDGDADDKKCRPKPPPPAIPEPGTWILLSSGAMGIFWRYRNRLRKA
jgi:hypothetical protein